MKINFTLLIYDGLRYYKGYPGVFLADYADLLGWNGERDEKFWERVEAHYYGNLEFQLNIDVCANTTIDDIELQIINRLGFDQLRFREFHHGSCFLVDREFVRIEDTRLSLSVLIDHYKIRDYLRYFLVFSNQAGEIWRDDGLRYYMNSRERGKHNEPHVHVDYKHESTVSICIYDGRVLDGNLPTRKLKLAQKRIEENKRFLLECWNKMTDGLRVDINVCWGIVPVDY